MRSTWIAVVLMALAVPLRAESKGKLTPVSYSDVAIESDKRAVLEQEGKTMGLTVLTEAETRLTTWSTAPKADYDAPNPGTCLVGFEVSVPATQALRTAVLLTPPNARSADAVDLQPLSEWSSRF